MFGIAYHCKYGNISLFFPMRNVIIAFLKQVNGPITYDYGKLPVVYIIIVATASTYVCM